MEGIMGMGIDKIADKIAGAGVSGLVLLVVMSTTGFAGAAAVTAALATLGGPAGMVGGVVLLALAATISAALATYGFEKIAVASIRAMVKKGSSTVKIRADIRKVPGLSSDLKDKLLKAVDAA
jgi:hypothetical protein